MHKGDQVFTCLCHNLSPLQAVCMQSRVGTTRTVWHRPCLPRMRRGLCVGFSDQVRWLILTCSDIFPEHGSQPGWPVQPGLPATAAHFLRGSLGGWLESRALTSPPSHRNSLSGNFDILFCHRGWSNLSLSDGVLILNDMLLNLGLHSGAITKPSALYKNWIFHL